MIYTNVNCIFIISINGNDITGVIYYNLAMYQPAMYVCVGNNNLQEQKQQSENEKNYF